MKIPTRISGFIRQERGSVLGLVLLMLVIAGITGGIFIKQSVLEGGLVERETDYQQAFASAESAFQAVAYTLKDSDYWANSYWSTVSNMTTPAGSAVVNVNIYSSNTRANIISTGTYNGISKQIVVVLESDSGGGGGAQGAGTFRAASPFANGNLQIDGRNHNLDQSLAGDNTGVPALVLEASEADFNLSGSADLGANMNGTDYGLENTTTDRVIFNATGLPETPDEVFNLDEGTLKAMAMAMGQYDYDPGNGAYTAVDGINYVEMPCSAEWKPGGITMDDPTIKAVLIVRSTCSDSTYKGVQGGLFQGILVVDQVDKLHGTVVGAIVGVGTGSGSALGNGSGMVLYCQEAVDDAMEDSGGGGGDPNLTQVSWTENRMY